MNSCNFRFCFVLYEFATLSVNYRENMRVRTFEYRALGRMCGTKRMEGKMWN